MTEPKKTTTSRKTRATRKPTSTFITKAADLSTEVFRKSDRLQAFLTGSSKSIGASCNVFVVDDSLSSIAEAAAWAIHVSGYQGAPSIELSRIRPRNSNISSGGNSSGAASFGKIYDGVIGSMRRPTKKNGAGILWLDWTHPDLEEFLSVNYSYAFRGVYIPADDAPESEREAFLSSKAFELIVDAFEHNKAFVCKRPGLDKYSSEPLYLNLCTEVEIPHLGFCILGVINLSQFNLQNLENLTEVFVTSVREMRDDMNAVLKNAPNTELACNSPANRQFGLGVSGLASMLANCGVKYAEFTNALADAFTTANENITYVAGRARDNADKSTAHKLVYAITKAYKLATDALGSDVSRAFCVQPSATGAYQCADISGFHSSPELQPVIGLRDNNGVHTIRKSEMLGNDKIVFHPDTETIDDVPYEVYANLCSLWQRLLDSTNLGHRHSACFYGDKFTKVDMLRFVNSHQKNLYYRLQPYNATALNKTDVGEGLETDVDLDSLLSEPIVCSIQTKGSTDCDCTM